MRGGLKHQHSKLSTGGASSPSSQRSACWLACLLEQLRESTWTGTQGVVAQLVSKAGGSYNGS